jgi:hypothetical protein
MAVYKVPQDVEADDKLIGPFSFRQFIYLIIVAVAGFVAYILSQIFIGLVIIPLPVMIFFLVLALPLRKEQPLELYFAAMVRFFLKPKLRMWIPDGSVALVEITAPKAIEEIRTKGLGQDEARDRLSYLAQVMDSRGWAAKGVAAPAAPAQPDPWFTQVPGAVEDVMDENTNVSRSFDSMLAQKDAQLRQQSMERMKQVASQTAIQTPPPSDNTYVTHHPKKHKDDDDEGPEYDPYPDMHQKVVHTLEDKEEEKHEAEDKRKKQQQKEAAERLLKQKGAQKASEPPVSPAIINLAYNPDLNLSTIAHEAHRIEGLSDDGQEVVIDLHKK